MMGNNKKIKKNILKTIIFIFLFGIQFIFSFPVSVQAAESELIKLTNPIGGTADNPQGDSTVDVIGARVIKSVMGVLGSITLLVFIVGGFMWLTSGGNPERVQMGSKTMLYAVIGIFIIFASYAILSAVIKGLTIG